MQNLRPSIAVVTFSLVWCLSITVSHRALGETKSPASAKALFDEAVRKEMERKVAAKQTELDRLGEDLKKAKQEIDELEQSIGKVNAAVADTTGQLEQLTAEKNRLTKDLDLSNLRLEADKLKAEGLKMLGNAHAKSRDALARRAEEIDLKTVIVAARMQELSAETSTENPGTSTKAKTLKGAPLISESQKKLAKAEDATAKAISIARQAMEAASLKLRQADSAAAKAEKKRAEIALEQNPSFPGGNDPLSSANP
jgi:chromosome segregation ATPase